MTVKDIMTKKVTGVSPELNAKEALALLQKMKISGLPVIDGKNRLVGMFTEKEVLSYVLPTYVENVGRFIYQENSKAIKNKVVSFFKARVKDLMRKDVVTISEDATVYEAAHLMLTQKARRVPVLDKEGAVSGIISRVDVVRVLFEDEGNR